MDIMQAIADELGMDMQVEDMQFAQEIRACEDQTVFGGKSR